MTKKNNKDNANVVASWVTGINRMAEEQRRQDQKLHPTKGQLRYVVDYARLINAHAQRIEVFSEMAHAQSGLLTFAQAQELINYQITGMQEAIKYLSEYIKQDEGGTD